MIKFCKINNEYIPCDDATIEKYKLDIELEISEKEFASKYNGQFHTSENGELILGSRDPKELAREELITLEIWFENYDKQIQQYLRAQRLNEEFDKDVTELDSLAQQKATRIKELRNLLKEE